MEAWLECKVGKKSRYYRLEVTPNLFGSYSVWRQWGRIGRKQSGCAVTIHPCVNTASQAFEAWQQAKKKRGYS